MKFHYSILLLASLPLFHSCSKDDNFNCADTTNLDIALLQYVIAETAYEMDTTGNNCLAYKEAIQKYLDEAAKFPKQCNIDNAFALDDLNALPCSPNSVYNDTFWVAGECSLTVPTNYNHNTQLDAFLAETVMYPQNYPHPNTSFFKDNSYSTTDRLQPGGQYRIVLYELLMDVEVVNCINFIKKEGGLLTSVQGLTLAMMNKTQCIASRNINVENRPLQFFSPDYASNLPNAGGVRGLPVIENYFVVPLLEPPYFTWNCYLYDFENIRKKGQYLLVYYN
jgi:hypothetical protein